MTAIQRRKKIFEFLTSSNKPVSATALSNEFGVTRQIIVGDIALLRAEGKEISATPRGYVVPSSDSEINYQIACCHNEQDTKKELYAIVDCGCGILDVIVEHPVYGQLTAPLLIKSRYDVDLFMEKMKTTEAPPLSLLTEGVHLHTITCPNDEVYNHLIEKLTEIDVLYKG